MKIMQFKIETGQKMLDLQGHNGDVAALSLRPDDKNVFVSGSVDRTARIWDLRTPGLEAGAELRGGGPPIPFPLSSVIIRCFGDIFPTLLF